MTAKTADWQHVDPLGEPWRGETDDHDAAGTTLGCDYAGRWVLDFIDPGRMQWSHRAFRSRKQAKLWAERNGVTIDAFDDRRLRLDPNHPEHGGPAQDGRDATTPGRAVAPPPRPTTTRKAVT